MAIGELEQESYMLGGFIRRIIAFAIDAALLSMFGLLLGKLFAAQFARMGGAGVLVGMAISWLYFGLLNSRLAGGQTAGKRLMGLTVVGSDGRLISIGRSLARASVVSLLLSQCGYVIDVSVLGNLAAIVVSGIVVGNLFLLMFNRRSRQLIHDLLSKTQVYCTSALGQRTAPSTPAAQKLICAAVVLAVIGCGELLGSSCNPALQASLGTAERLNALDGVYNANCMNMSTRKIYGQGDGGKAGAPLQSLQVSVCVKEPPVDSETLKNKIAKTVLDSYPELQSVQSIRIAVYYGYNIGIASSYSGASTIDSPEKWRARVALLRYAHGG